MAKQKLITVRISRKRWYTADHPDVDSCLRIGKGSLFTDTPKKYVGMQCCLGFAARACGLSSQRITGLATPENLFTGTNKHDDRIPAAFRRFVKVDRQTHAYNTVVDNATTVKMVEINDHETLTRAQKEKALKPLARKLGFRFIFVP